MDQRFRILILSAGSLLAQNLFDTLEGRRSRVYIIGMNTEADSGHVFRCDKLYRAPLTKSPEYRSFLLQVIDQEKPDFILPGRDLDVLVLAELVRDYPDLKRRVAVGAAEAVQMMIDKSKTYLFAKQHQLPFAETFLFTEKTLSHAGTLEVLDKWLASVGYPLLAKPVIGFGSQGIRLIGNDQQLQAFLKKNQTGYLLQQVTGFSQKNIEHIVSLAETIDQGPPLFSYIIDNDQYGGQALILPDGSIGPMFTGLVSIVIGKAEKVAPVEDPLFLDMVRRYAEAISAFGWRGFINLQFRKSENGYVLHEINPRMSGASSTRAWMGYDEIRDVIKAYTGHDIGADERYPIHKKGVVYRTLSDYFVADEDIQQFYSHGVVEPFKWQT